MTSRKSYSRYPRAYAVLLVASASLGTLHAWEADVHYGLTRCLAIKAGFSKLEAQEIAKANQSLDDYRGTKATWLVPRHIMFNLSEEDALYASMIVRHHHFPSLAEPPATAAERSVSHDSPYARHLLSGSENPLQLGRALHSFQDSWSHKGKPDIPLRGWGPMIRPNLSWGHPESRGEWRRHSADLTHLHVQDTVKMAQRTYEELLQFRIQKKGEKPPKGEMSWDKLKSSIYRFAEQSTKKGKRKWFQEECGLDQVQFLSKTSLDEGGGIFSDLRDRFLGNYRAALVVNRESPLPQSTQDHNRPLLFSLTSDEMPAGLWDFSRSFLETWLVRHEIGALTESIDVVATARRMRTGLEATDSHNLVRKAFAMWLLEDHGMVEKLGHGIPDREGYERLPANLSEAGGEFRVVRYRSLAEALKPGVGGVAVDLVKLNNRSEISVEGDSAYILAFELEHLDYDTLILIIERKTSWKVTGLLWFTA